MSTQPLASQAPHSESLNTGAAAAWPLWRVRVDTKDTDLNELCRVLIQPKQNLAEIISRIMETGETVSLRAAGLSPSGAPTQVLVVGGREPNGDAAGVFIDMETWDLTDRMRSSGALFVLRQDAPDRFSVDETGSDWFSSLTSLTAAQVIDRVHPNDRLTVENFLECSADGEVGQIQLRVEDGDGAYHWMRAIAPVPESRGDNAKTVRHILLIDVDESQQEVDRQRRATDRSLFMEEASDIGVWDWDVKRNRHWCSPRFLGLLDPPAGARMDWDLFESRLHPEERDAVTQAILSTLDGKADRGFQFELQMADEAGRFRWMECIGSTRRNDVGDPYRLLVGLRDISDRKDAELALLESRARFAEIVATAATCVFETDQFGRITYMSENTHRLYGKNDDAFLAKRFTALCPGADRATRRRIMDAALNPRGVRNLEFAITNPAGKTIWLRANARRRYGADGGLRGWLGSVIDVTKNKQTESALRNSTKAAETALKAKSDFLAIVSHETRTPLNVIIGLSQVLGGRPLDTQSKSMVAEMRTAGMQLLALVDDVLDFSKLEGGFIKLAEHPLTLDQVARSSITGFEDRALAKGLDFSIVVEPSVADRQFLGDRKRICQAYRTIVDNAVKFTQQGSVRGFITPSPDRRGWMRFAVRDTGPGVPDEHRDKLFTKLTQGDSSMRRAHGGTGLGLAICEQIVKLMKGHVGWTSEQGAGSVFYFDVPLSALDADPIEALAEQTNDTNENPPEYKGIAMDELLDEKFLSEMISITGKDILKGIVDTFWSVAGELANDIRAAVREENGQALKAASHSLKGAAMNVGAAKIANVCQALEHSAPSDPEVPDLLVQLDAAMHSTPDALATRLS